MTGPQSRLPNRLTVMGRKRVSARARPISAITARNLPMTNCAPRTGRVSKISSVPDCCSSLHWRIVNAAARKISKIGIHWKRGRTSAMPRAKKVLTQKKEKRVAARKAPRKISAIGDPK